MISLILKYAAYTFINERVAGNTVKGAIMATGIRIPPDPNKNNISKTIRKLNIWLILFQIGMRL